jgi:HlyD family secretion protein
VDAYPDRTFRAGVEEVRFASEIVQGVVTYKATLAVDNSELLLRPGMTATAEIAVQEVKSALLVPNAALRFTPPAQAPAEGEVPLLRRILPGPPHFRAASPREETGPSRRAWVLENGRPVEVPVTVGVSDGRSTQVLEGALREGQPVIVDSTTVR